MHLSLKLGIYWISFRYLQTCKSGPYLVNKDENLNVMVANDSRMSLKSSNNCAPHNCVADLLGKIYDTVGTTRRILKVVVTAEEAVCAGVQC